MSKRGRNLVLAVISLVLGSLLYVLFRSNTHLAKLCSCIPTVATAQLFFAGVHIPFLTVYLVDFLWGLSLCCGLLAIHDPGVKGKIVCAVAAFIWGCLWEMMQWLSVVGGTGDWLDVCMYFLAAFVGIIINLKERKHEKND